MIFNNFLHERCSSKLFHEIKCKVLGTTSDLNIKSENSESYKQRFVRKYDLLTTKLLYIHNY